jgi:hypothetical protein
VRLDTGSSKEAVAASQTVVNANSFGGMSSCRAIASTTGVSRTAQVSRDRTIVSPVASPTTSSQSRQTRPRARWAASRAATSKTFASSASSAMTVTAIKNTRTGAIRSTKFTDSHQAV